MLQVSEDYCEMKYTLEEVLMNELLLGFEASCDPAKRDSWPLGVVEGMVGCQEMCAAFRNLGFAAVALDKRYDERLDFNEVIGFRVFLIAARNLRVFGLFWFALVCKSWIWLTRNLTKRSAAEPYGNPNAEMVAAGNKMLEHFVVIALLLGWSKKCWIVEQPADSVQHHTDAMQTLMTIHDAKVVVTDHGAFDWEDAPVKPLRLVGRQTPWLDEVKETAKGKEDRAKLCTKKRKTLADGTVKIATTGRKEELHTSEHYCKGFCARVAACYATWLSTISHEDAEFPQLARGSND